MAANDPQAALVEVTSSTLDHAQMFWASQVESWRDARVVLYTGKEPSPCGQADQTTGPFYCPPDEHVFLDLSFLATIHGDLARAYVVAHEIGHHVQKLRGEFNGRPSVDIELEADCYAGMWAADEQKRGMLDTDDVAGALAETAAVGDDRICPGCSPEQSGAPAPARCAPRRSRGVWQEGHANEHRSARPVRGDRARPVAATPTRTRSSSRPRFRRRRLTMTRRRTSYPCSARARWRRCSTSTRNSSSRSSKDDRHTHRTHRRWRDVRAPVPAQRLHRLAVVARRAGHAPVDAQDRHQGRVVRGAEERRSRSRGRPRRSTRLRTS